MIEKLAAEHARHVKIRREVEEIYMRHINSIDPDTPMPTEDQTRLHQLRVQSEEKSEWLSVVETTQNLVTS